MKSRFIKSTLILLIGGIITKLLSFIIRVYFTRIIGPEGINIYALVMPTYSLLITITQLGFPIAISNIIAKGEKRGTKVVFSVIPISLILNLFLISLVLVFAKYLSTNLLHNPNTFFPLIAIAFILPFISLSSIIRGYFFGKQKMLPHVISNIIEQLFKLMIVLLVLPKLLNYGTIIAVSGYILISILSETMSIIIFLLFLPKGFKININDLKPDLGTIKDVLRISLPSVGSRIIGNIGYFLEPIVLTYILLRVGYSENFILGEYAIYNTYVIDVIVVPTYLLMALSISLIPEISKSTNDKKKIQRIFNKVMLLSLLLGLISNLGIFLFGSKILMIVFHTTKGLKYLKFLCLFFTPFYLEAPLSSILQGMNKANIVMQTTIISVIFKLTIMVIISLFNVGIYGLIISEILNIILVVGFNYYKVYKIIKS